MPSPRPRGRGVPHLLLLAVALAAALWGALMFALANDDWIVVRFPTPPWSPAPSTPIFEARLFAIMLACLAVGALAASALWRHALASARRRSEIESARSRAMEAELTALGRLVSSERDRSLAAKGAPERAGGSL
jgi:hypothetical protein